MVITGLILTISSIGCGKGHVETRFQPYLESFKAEAKAHGKEVDIEHINVVTAELRLTTSGTRAYCYVAPMQNPTIYIDSWWWETPPEDTQELSEAVRTMIIFHELGHCLLGRVHNDGYIKKEGEEARHISIMHSNTAEPKDFIKYRDEYLTELFATQ